MRRPMPTSRESHIEFSTIAKRASFARQMHVGLPRDELNGLPLRLGRTAEVPPLLDPQVAAVAPAQSLQLFQESRHALAVFWIILGERGQDADAARTLLRNRCQRAGDHRPASQQHNEIAPPHADAPALLRCSTILRSPCGLQWQERFGCDNRLLEKERACCSPVT